VSYTIIYIPTKSNSNKIEGLIVVFMVADFCFWVHLQRSKHVQASRMKWWKLKEKAAKTFKERVLKDDSWHKGKDTNIMWMKMFTCIRKVVSEEFGVTKGDKRETKET
jgi:hypothetical protein